MWRYIFIAVSLVGFSVKGPELMTRYLDGRDKANVRFSNAENTTSKRPSKTQKRKSSHNPLAGRTARARMQSNGHFYFNTKMNGASVKVMVDTGATGVAINRSTARRLGIKLTNADFKHKSQTANGIAYFASATIDEIKIGRVIVNNVRAAVLKDSSLNSTLLGMTFLRKLRKFEISNSTLILTQ